MTKKKPVRRVAQKAIADETYLPKPRIKPIKPGVDSGFRPFLQDDSYKNDLFKHYETLPEVTVHSKTKYKTLPNVTVSSKKKSPRIKLATESTAIQRYNPITKEITSTANPGMTKEQIKEATSHIEQGSLKDYAKDITAVTQFFPHPIISVPSMMINSGIGINDALENEKKKQYGNEVVNTAGALPWGKMVPGWPGKVLEGISAISDLTNNFGLEQQKNGGWLDNYGEEANANEGHSSAPKEWIGEGYSNVGRNYSPAWGGQFQLGGEIPQAQKGYKTLPPVVIESKSDPRYKAYQDSLRMYNLNGPVSDLLYKTELEKSKMVLPYSRHVDDIGYPDRKGHNVNNFLKATDDVINFLKNIKNPRGIKPSVVNPNYKNYNEYARNIQETITGNPDIKPNQMMEILWKKPVQPYILQQEPKLRGKQVTHVEPRKLDRTAFTPGIVGQQHPNIQLPPIQQGRYKVDYFDPTEGTDVQGGWHTKSFMSDKEAGDYMHSRPMYGPSMTQRVEYQLGGSVYPVNYVPQAAMGGSLPGSVGFTYARTGSIPSEGPYAKKTLPSAQNGKKTGNPVSDWWYNLDDVQGTYKMYNDLDPFLKNWYQNPETQKRLKQNLQDSHRNTNPSQLTSQAINTLQNTPAFSRELINKADVSSSDLEYNNELQGWKSPSTYGGNPYFDSFNYMTGSNELGSYDPATKQIIVNSFNQPGTVAHEGVHGTPELQNAMEDIISWKYFDKKDPKTRFSEQFGTLNWDANGNDIREPFEKVKNRLPSIYSEWEKDQEYLDKDGMYPRIMDIRKTLNLKPGQKVDKSILENESISHPLDDLKHYYDGDTIIEMINTLAKNKSNNELSSAQNGTNLVEIPQVKTLEEGKKNSADWLTNWYKERAKDPKFTELANERLQVLPNLNIEGDPDLLKYREAYGTYNNAANNYDITVDTSSNPLGIQTSNILHETIHGLGNLAPQKNLPNIFAQNDLIDPYGNIDFVDQDEKLARLNQFRMRFGIDPNKEYTTEEMKGMMEDFKSMPAPSEKDSNSNFDWNVEQLFDMLGNDPEKLRNLNRDVVRNNNKQSTIAQLGTKKEKTVAATEDDLGPIAFLNSYTTSPEFKKRFKGTPAEYKLSQDILNYQAQNYKPFVLHSDPNNIGSRASEYMLNKQFGVPDDISVILSEPQAKSMSADLYNDILPHEYAHKIRHLGLADQANFAFSNNNPVAGNLFEAWKADTNKKGEGKTDFSRWMADHVKDSHDEQPNEQYSDLDSLRFLMYKQGIYDTRKGSMTNEHIQKALKDPYIRKQIGVKRLLQKFSPEKIMKLNNQVAVNDQEVAPTAENGMTYYQHGLDWEPKMISKNGGWLDNYAKNGTTTSTQTTKAVYVLPSYTMPRAGSSSTSHVFNTATGPVSTATTGQKKEDVAASNQDLAKYKIAEEKEKAKRIAERKAAKAFKEGKTKTFTLPNDETKTLEQMDAREKAYVTGKSIEGKGRINENDEAWYDTINPLNWITEAAGALGEAPYEARQSDSNLPYLSSIAAPLIGGAMGFNPLGSAMKVPGKLATSIESGLISKFKPSLSSSIKNVGSKLESPTAGTDYIWNSVNKNIKGNLPEGLTKQNVADVLENNLSWIESPEYLKRRMATTGETAEQVTKDIQALKKRFANTKIKFTNKGLDKDTQGLYSAQPSILSNIDADVIKIDPNQSIEEIIATIDHEVLHGLSPALKNPKLYENYPFLPTTEGDNLRDLGSKQGFFDKLWKGDKSNSYVYLEDPAEQQVRFNRLNAKVREDLNLPKNEGKLTEEQFNQWTNAQLEDKFNSFLSSGYYDVGELLQNKASNIDRSKILETLNKAWGVIPAVGVAGAAASTMGGAQQKKQGGVIKNQNAQFVLPSIKPATSSDSSVVKAGALAQQAWLKQHPEYVKTGSVPTKDYLKNTKADTIHRVLSDTATNIPRDRRVATNAINNDIARVKEQLNNPLLSSSAKLILEQSLKALTTKKNKVSSEVSGYKVKTGPHTYKQRELTANIINPNVPMGIYDDRIQPQRVTTYENVNATDPYLSDVVEIPEYDPIAVKPRAEVTKKELQYLIKTYNNPADKKLFKEKFQTPIKQTVVEQPIVEKTKPVVETPVVTTPVVTETAKPTYKTSVHQGTPIYGPSQSLIGTVDNDKFYPATGEQSKGMNTADVNLMQDPTAFQKYIDQKVGRGAGYAKIQPLKKGGVIKDDRGQWDHPGEITEIQGNNMATNGYGDIPLYVVPDVGEPRMINANTGNHTFPGATKFTEFPIKKKSKGWLDKYN